MKSCASSSVASDDTLEPGKDQLDFSVDFPPLLGSGVTPGGPPDDQFVPKWVDKVAKISDCNKPSSNVFSSSAVIDASDSVEQEQKQEQQADEKSSLPAPPPDVTVVPTQNASQQCTVASGLLPDVAAQAPNVINTTNR